MAKLATPCAGRAEWPNMKRTGTVAADVVAAAKVLADDAHVKSENKARTRQQDAHPMEATKSRRQCVSKWQRPV